MKDCIKQSLSFWSWNDKLEQKKLIKQIERMRDCGFGGFFMHARSGLKTEYLSKEWFDCVRTCIKKAKELKIKPWLYDENGWPSGAAGGRLLSDEKCLENFLTLIAAFSKVSCDINSMNNPHALISKPSRGTLLMRLESGTIIKSKEYRVDRTEMVLNSLFKAINQDNQKLYYKRSTNGTDYIDYELRIKKMISGQVRDLPFEYESYGNFICYARRTKGCNGFRIYKAS